MAKENGDSQFGFKDKAKAEETLTLLEEHDMQYRKLTVRGLLGRAKRVLTMTKAEDKIKNIKEAMEVFENWLEENGVGSSNKNSKTDSNDKVETVSGLGFKDKEAAEKTLKILDGRDPDYQKLAVKGLIGSSKRVLSGTKNEDKIKAIKEGVAILEEFLEKFELENRSKLNFAYLAHNIIAAYPKPTNKLVAEFISVYGGRAKGNYKHLRTLYPEDNDSLTWDIVRNQEVKLIKEKIAKNNSKLFNDDGSPTEDHLNLIYWAYSPQTDKVKSYAEKNKSKAEKRKSSAPSSSSSSDSEEEQKQSKKRKS
ncbi:hypothetical protein Bhyg_10854 [Pseudolycoriella hygida]|uniref:Uncharacterized protein n=1 Tax=Pseudolycoriella hygida TaxID=35572 RepID=A0A9Q0MU92_9DIPT|nr:hypothetical protein Bhyg_10854 [Pseudolycoriella hygida]